MAVRHSSGFRRERSAEQLGQVGGEQLVLLTLVGLVGAVSFTGLGTSASEAIGVSSSGGVPAASVSAMAGTVDGDDTSGGGGVPGSGGGSGTLSSEAGTVLPSDGASMDAAAVAAGLEAGGSGDAEGAGAVDGSGSVVSPASSEGGGGDGSGDGAGGFFSRAFGGIGRAVSGFGASVARITKGFFSGIGDGVTSTWLHFTGDAELAADAGAGKGGQCTWWNVVCHGKNVGSALWGGVKGLAKRIGRIPGWFMDKVLPKGDELAAGGIGAMPVGFDDVSFAAPAGGPAFNDISLASGAGLGGALDPEPPPRRRRTAATRACAGTRAASSPAAKVPRATTRGARGWVALRRSSQLAHGRVPGTPRHVLLRGSRAGARLPGGDRLHCPARLR
jgi:hypothetical protein